MSASQRRPLPEFFGSKLTPVARLADGIFRTGIEQLANVAGAPRLVVVCGPAGFGKTTAMVQLRELYERQQMVTAWLTLDRADNDIPRFLASITAATVALNPDGHSDVMDTLSSETGPFALFLDDFELIQEAGVVDLVREIIDRLPRGGRVVIGTRVQPELGLGRLRARGQLMEIDADALRFTAVEADDFLRRRGAELSTRDLEDVVTRTEGWPAALWLLSLALQRPGARLSLVSRLLVSDRGVTDYLSEEVLAQQPTDVRTFLLRTSVLRQLSLPVCQALLPQINCAEVLKNLERSNVFLSAIAGAEGHYRYHSLFADFLKAQLDREQPEQPARLHLAASGWYEEQGRPVPAIDHAIEGGDLPHALDLLERHASALLEAGRMRLLDRWFCAIPEGLLGRQVRLASIAVWARCFTQGPWKAMEWLDRSGVSTSEDPVVRAHLQAQRPVLLAMMDRYDDAQQAGEAGLSNLPTGQAFADSVLFNAMAHIVSVVGDRRDAQNFLRDARQSQSDSAFNRMYTETIEGVLDLREGRFREALARFRVAVASNARPDIYRHDSGNAWAGIFLAEAVYESNDLDAAERLLNVYLPMARNVGLPDHLITSHRLRSRIHFWRGNVDAAFQTLGELETLAHDRHLPRVVASARLERSWLFLMQGNEPASRDELLSADDPVVWEAVARQARSAHELEDHFIARLRFDLHFGDAADVIGRIDPEWRRGMSASRRYRVTKLRVLLAMAFYRTGDVGRATAELNVTLRDASREGFVRILLDEGAALAPLLRRVFSELADRTSPTDPVLVSYSQGLLEALGPLATEEVAQDFQPEGHPREELTVKEIRVLQLLAEGYSNAAMAEKLFVSDSTVRTHLRNINAKLDCRSRTQAVAVARRLGLIR